MKVDDLYVIVRELQQIQVLQANLLAKLPDNNRSLKLARTAQTEANKILQKLLEKYNDYSI